MQLGVFMGDVLALGIDGAIGIAADGMFAFVEEIMGDDRSIMFIQYLKSVVVGKDCRSRLS